MAKEIDKYQVSLKLFLKNDRGEVLAMKAALGGSFSGFYDLPGGRIDVEEFTTPLETIIAREVREELGEIEYVLRPQPVAVGRHAAGNPSIGKGYHVIYIFFEADYLRGQPVISDEHTDYQWFDLKNTELEKYFKSGLLDAVKMYLKGQA